MNETRVKICGLTHPDDVRCAVAAGADFLGFVFAPSPRQVDGHDLERWLDTVRAAAEVVGVFQDASIDEVLEAVERFDLDFVQLHGGETGEAWKRLPVRLIETRRVEAGHIAPARFEGAAWAELLDTGAGTGHAFPWELAFPVARARRTFVAGGLDPFNVAEAVERSRPFAVDVSSGVEIRPGRKDPAAVRAFVIAAKGAR